MAGIEIAVSLNLVWYLTIHKVFCQKLLPLSTNETKLNIHKYYIQAFELDSRLNYKKTNGKNV